MVAQIGPVVHEWAGLWKFGPLRAQRLHRLVDRFELVRLEPGQGVCSNRTRQSGQHQEDQGAITHHHFFGAGSPATKAWPTSVGILALFGISTQPATLT